jgi:hypothetical protein
VVRIGVSIGIGRVKDVHFGFPRIGEEFGKRGDKMTGKGAKDRTKSDLLVHRQHGSIEIAEPEHRG